MVDLSSIQRCADLSQRDVEAASGTRDDLRALLDHLASVSRPKEGAGRVLLVFRELARGTCDWMEGELRLELIAYEDDQTLVEALADLGGGMRERVFPPFVLRAPLAEFRQAFKKAADVLEPLTLKADQVGRLVAIGTGQAVPTQMPPAVDIDAASVYGATGGVGAGAHPLRVPALAPVPAFEPIQGGAAPSSRGGSVATGEDELADDSWDFADEAVSASRTMIPAGGAPPQAPVVDVAKRRKAEAAPAPAPAAKAPVGPLPPPKAPLKKPIPRTDD